MSSLWPLLIFAFVLGTIIGSFLNVVIYRLPRGKGLIYPGSSCPACNRPIRWYDNVPLVSWLWLRGRCRDCGAAISARYPIVELAVGLMFVALAWTDIILPWQAAQAAVGEGNPVASDEFVLHFLYHVILLCPLFAATAIDLDGQRVPRQLITWPSAVGILLAAFWPTVQALQLHVSYGTTAVGAGINAVLTGFVGMLAAVGVRILAIRIWGGVRLREIGLAGATLALYIVGALLGWQAAFAIGALAIFSTLLKRTGRAPASVVVLIAALVWCLLERQIAVWL